MHSRHADDQRANNIYRSERNSPPCPAELTEKQDTVDDPAGSSRDLLGRVGAFRCGQDDRLGPAVSEAGVHEARKERGKAGSVVVADAREGVHRSRVFPVPEPSAVAIRRPSEVDHQSDDDEAGVSLRRLIAAHKI